MNLDPLTDIKTPHHSQNKANTTKLDLKIQSEEEKFLLNTLSIVQGQSP